MAPMGLSSYASESDKSNGPYVHPLAQKHYVHPLSELASVGRTTSSTTAGTKSAHLNTLSAEGDGDTNDGSDTDPENPGGEDPSNPGTDPDNPGGDPDNPNNPDNPDNPDNPGEGEQPAHDTTPTPTPAQPEVQPTQVYLLATGDNLIHTQIYESCRKKDGSYDFTGLYKHVKSDIQEADIAVINQETMLTNKEPSGFPSFSTPRRDMCRAIVDTGFDVIQHASNHTLDQGGNAIIDEVKFWNKHYPKIKVIGMHSSKKKSREITIINKNGIKIAMINFTQRTNDHMDRVKGRRWLVNIIRSGSKLKRDVAKARKKADFVVAFMHMGDELTYNPTKYSKQTTKLLANLGVDLMIGTHPHVLEPVKWIKGKNGHKMLAYYSLGNFVNARKYADRLLGGMAKVIIEKDATGTHIKKYKMTPIVTHINKTETHYAVYKLADYTGKLASKHYLGEEMRPSNLRKLYTKITGRNPWKKK